MQHSSSSEANSYPACQKFPAPYRTLKFHYHDVWKLKFLHHASMHPSLVSALSEINSVHTLPSYFFQILTLSSHLCLVLTSGPMYAILFYPIHATYTTDLTLLDLITVIIYGEDYKVPFSSTYFLTHMIYSLLENIILQITKNVYD